MFWRCRTCEAMEKQVEYLQGLVDRLMTQTWPKVDSVPEPPEPAAEEDSAVAERIKFGEG
jgi:hypothetical protein